MRPGIKELAHPDRGQTPFCFCLQNARLSTVRPASATTSAPSVRRACTCTRAAAIQPVPRAPQQPTAPWSAAALVRSGCQRQRAHSPEQRAGWKSQRLMAQGEGEEQDRVRGRGKRKLSFSNLLLGILSQWPEVWTGIEWVGEWMKAPQGHSDGPEGRGGLFLSSLLPHLPSAQCEMSEWSPWGPCSKKRKLCGFRKGSEERTRRVLHAPGGDHTTCTDTKETRKCTVRKTPCPEGELQPLPPGISYIYIMPGVPNCAKWGPILAENSALRCSVAES